VWLPPLSLLAALGARGSRGWCAGAGGGGLSGDRRRRALDAWRSSTVPRLYGAIGLTGPDPVREVANALRREIEPGDPVWVVNYHPVLHVMAKAGLATRYTFPAQLVGPYWRVTGIDPNEEVERILASNPTAIVIDRGWWPDVRPRIAAMIEEALAEHYDLAAVVYEERGPVEVWRLRDTTAEFFDRCIAVSCPQAPGANPPFAWLADFRRAASAASSRFKDLCRWYGRPGGGRGSVPPARPQPASRSRGRRRISEDRGRRFVPPPSAPFPSV